MKAKLKTGEIIDVVFTRLNLHVAELIFMSKEKEWPTVDDVKGFSIIRESGEVLFDGTRYMTLYREIAGGYQLSDDGSIYIAPVEPDLVEPPEELPEERTERPTTEQRLSNLENHVYNNI